MPFKLTNDQRRAAWQIIQDLGQPVPMNRLLQGDVGTGKTIVALLAAVSAVEAGQTVVWLAPTQVLAIQLVKRINHHLAPLCLTARLVIAGQSIARSPIGLLIGTHALLHQDQLTKLGLVIVDEQHRFGVEQRTALLPQASLTPHLLAMSATPIPRTLALTFYGETSCTVLSARPRNQQPIRSILLPASQRRTIFPLLERAIAAGRQAFVIVPRIHRERPTELLPALGSLEDFLTEYQAALPRAQVAAYHGELAAAEAARVMAAFETGTIDLLVATTMIEVGIDIPNAAVIVIEGAERFGLSQLHQLRGRVGRGAHPGICIVIPSAETAGRERLERFVATTDGFKLAELDLAERGPGELAGTNQTGFLKLRFADLNDMVTARTAQRLARQWLAKPPPGFAAWQKIFGDGRDARPTLAD